jgi:hypothetical protein
MPEVVRKVRLSELDGKRVVDKDGLDVKIPPRPQLPKAPEKDQAAQFASALSAATKDIVSAVEASTSKTLSGLVAVAASNKAVAEAVTNRPVQKQPKRWTIKVRREAGQISDMTATPEYS